MRNKDTSTRTWSFSSQKAYLNDQRDRQNSMFLLHPRADVRDLLEHGEGVSGDLPIFTNLFLIGVTIDVFCAVQLLQTEKPS